MCGIAGFYSPSEKFSKEELYSMNSFLKLRGPDAEGHFYEKGVGLAHKRLSILDLSTAANQPMFSKDERFVIVFNGEVFNFRELAKKWNLSLRTTSDTEVILEGFAKHGCDFVQELNGMFAFVIYDREKKEIFAFRDRLGLKPIYYYWDGHNFIFASELKAFNGVTQLPLLDEIDFNAIQCFLRVGFIAEPDSIYKKIRKFPSGHYLKVSDGKFELNKYWKLEDKVEKDIITDEREAKEKLKSLLISSIKYRLISDVPFGVFLSGGIDSSLITAIAQSVHDSPIKTFSIGFKERKFNEAEYSKKVANYLGTDHHEFYLSEKEAADVFEEVLNNYDEPFADTSAVPTFMVSRLARKYVTTILTGDGGDEQFMGYGSYAWAQRLSSPLLRYSHSMVALLLGMMPSSRYKRAAHLFRYGKNESIPLHIFSQENYFFSNSEMCKIMPAYPGPCNEMQTDFDQLSRTLTPREKQSLFDLKYYLRDDLLVKVDRASMQCSLEAREPLLDYRIVEFALNVSEDLKIKNGESKYILKQVLYDYVPAEFFQRPKWGFSIPLSSWLKNELRYLLEDNLSKEAIDDVGLFEYKEVQQLLKRYFNGEDYLFNRIFVLIVIQKWMKKHKEKKMILK